MSDIKVDDDPEKRGGMIGVLKPRSKKKNLKKGNVLFNDSQTSDEVYLKKGNQSQD